MGKNPSYVIEIETHLTDIKDQIKKYEKDLRGLQSTAEKMGFGENISKEIQDGIEKLHKLQNEYTESMKKFSQTKLDSGEFEKFTKLVDSRMEEMATRITDTERILMDLSQKMAGFKGGDELKAQVDKMRRQFNNFTRDMKDTVSVLKDFQSLVAQSSNSQELKNTVRALNAITKIDLTDLSGIKGTKKDLNSLQESLADSFQTFQQLKEVIEDKSSTPTMIKNAEEEMSALLPKMSEVIKRIAKINKIDASEMFDSGYTFNSKTWNKTFDLDNIINSIDTETARLRESLNNRATVLKDESKNLKESVTEISTFTIEGGEIKVPVILDPNALQSLKTDFNEMVQHLNTYAESHPVDVVFRLFPMSGTRAEENELAKSIKDIRAQIPKTGNEELQGSVNKFVDNLEKQYQKAIKVRIAIELSQSADDVTKDIEKIQKAAKDANIVIYPKFEISKEEATKLQDELDKISEDFTFDVTGKITKMTDSLTKLLNTTNVSEWSEAFASALGDISKQLIPMKALIEPLAMLSVSQNIKNKPGRPSKETLENRSYVESFTKAMENLNTALDLYRNAKKKVDVDGKEIIGSIQDAVDKAGTPINVKVVPNIDGFVDALQNAVGTVPIAIEGNLNKITASTEASLGVSNKSVSNTTDPKSITNDINKQVEAKKNLVNISKEELDLQIIFNKALDTYLDAMAKMEHATSDKSRYSAQDAMYELAKGYPIFNEIKSRNINAYEKENLFSRYYNQKTGNRRDWTHYNSEAQYQMLQSYARKPNYGKAHSKELEYLVSNFRYYQELGGTGSLEGLTNHKRVQKNLVNEYNRQIEALKKNTEAKKENASTSSQNTQDTEKIKENSQAIQENTEKQQENIEAEAQKEIKETYKDTTADVEKQSQANKENADSVEALIQRYNELKTEMSDCSDAMMMLVKVGDNAGANDHLNYIASLANEASVVKDKILKSGYYRNDNGEWEKLNQVTKTESAVTNESQSISKFAGKTDEELKQCLATEERWLARCKEGSDKYNERKANIAEINSLLKQNADVEAKTTEKVDTKEESADIVSKQIEANKARIAELEKELDDYDAAMSKFYKESHGDDQKYHDLQWDYLKKHKTDPMQIHAEIDKLKAENEQLGREAGEAAVEGAKEGTQEAQQSSYPSKVAELLGGDWGQGYANGILKSKEEVEAAVRELVTTGKLTTAELINDIANMGVDTVFKDLLEPSTNISTELLNASQSTNTNSARQISALKGQVTKIGNHIAKDSDIDAQKYAELAKKAEGYVNKLKELGVETSEIEQKFRDTTEEVYNRFKPVDTKDSSTAIKEESTALKELPASAKEASEAKEEFASANHEVLSSIIESLKGLDAEGNGFANLNKLINTLGGKSGDEKLTKTVEGLQSIYEVLNQDISDNALINALNELASKGADLEKLATVLKATKKQIANAQKAIDESESEKLQSVMNSQDVSGNARKYLEQYGEVVNLTQEVKKGFIQITSTVLDADDQFRRFTLTTKDGLNMTIAKEEEHTASLEKEILLYSKLLKAVNGMNRVSPNQTNEVFIEEGSSVWNDIIEYSKEYGENLGKILSITRSVREVNGELLESFKIVGENGSVTIGAENDAVASIQNIANITKQYKELLKLQNKLNDTDLKNQQNETYTPEYIAQVREMVNLIDSVQFDLTNPEDVARLEKMVAEAKELDFASKNADNTLGNMKNLEKLRQKIADTLNDYGAMPRKLKDEFNDLKGSVDYFLKAGSIASSQSDELNRKFLELNANLSESGKKYQSLGKQMLERLRSQSSQLLAQYFSFQDMIRYAREAYTTIKELDSALIDLRKTTAMNNTELNEFYRNSTEIGKSLGVTSQQVIQQAADWSRLGYNTSEASETMSKLSSMFASISPGMSTDQSTDYLVSTMKAFGIETDEVQRKIMDNVNRIGKILPKHMVTYGAKLLA